MRLLDYECKTTFWNDFSIAERFGAEAIRDTYKRARTERVVCEPPSVAAHNLILLQNPDIFKIKKPPIEVLMREAEMVHFIL